jgi:hypothetical protein
LRGKWYEEYKRDYEEGVVKKKPMKKMQSSGEF